MRLVVNPPKDLRITIPFDQVGARSLPQAGSRVHVFSLAREADTQMDLVRMFSNWHVKQILSGLGFARPDEVW